jgi:hypothetical protein
MGTPNHCPKVVGMVGKRSSTKTKQMIGLNLTLMKVKGKYFTKIEL